MARPGVGGLLAFWIVAWPASAELLTPTRVAEMALATHPSVAAARAERQASEAEHDESRALFRPVVQLGVAATQYEEPSLASPIHGFRPDLFPTFDTTLYQPSVRASYTLFDGGARRARREQTAAQVERAGARLAAEEQALVARVARAYLQVLSLAEVLAADGARREALGLERDRAGKLFAAGRAAEVEVKRGDAAFAAAEAERAARAARLDQAERALARLIGVEAEAARAPLLSPLTVGGAPLSPLAPSGPLEAALAGPAREDLERRAREASPSAEAARESAAAAEATVAQATAARRPSVQLVGNEVGYGSAEGDFTAEWSAGFQLSFPLFTGGAAAARLARAEALSTAAREQVRAAELAALSELDAALTAEAEALARAASLAAAVASFAEVARIEKLRLDAEAGTQSDYLDAEADLLGARAAWVEARYAALAARVDVARAVGGLDPAWLAANLQAEPILAVPEAPP